MAEEENTSPANHLYAEGKKYDWKQDRSPPAATLARANFQQAASMGHQGAVRALAHLIYEGRGGPQDREHGLLLLWSAFKRGDDDALEELSDLLATYAEEAGHSAQASKAAVLANTVEEVNVGLGKISSFMDELAHIRSRSLSI